MIVYVSFYCFTVIKGTRIRTVSRLSEQPIVWIDDLIGQNVEPLPNNTLTLKHKVEQNQASESESQANNKKKEHTMKFKVLFPLAVFIINNNNNNIFYL